MKKVFALQPMAAAIMCATVTLSAQQVFAQGRTTALEEVIVTAQKREESLQDAPIAVTALTSEQLANKGIQGLGDMISGAVPSIKIMPFPQNPGTLTISMRGIGPSDAGQITKEPGVGIYMDGIYLGRSQGLGLDIADLERIEVLRGPQGTLYGRNVMGGAVNLITKKPSGEFGFKQTLSYGDKYGEFKSITHIDTPTVAGFSAKLSYLLHDHEGNIRNQGSGKNYEDYNAYEKEGGRLAVNWNNDNNLSVDYALDWSDNKIMQNYFQLYDAGRLTTFNADQIEPPNLGLLSVPIPEWTQDQFNLLGNIGSGAYLGALQPFPNEEPSTSRVGKTRAALALRPNEVENQGHALTINWDLNENLTLRSLTSYRELDQETHTNYAGVFGIGLANSAPYDKIEQEQWSQELQLIGAAMDDRIEYVFGAYYYSEEVSEVTPPTSTAMEVAFVPLSTNPADLALPGSVAPFIVTRGGVLSTLNAAVPLAGPSAPYPNRLVDAETKSWAVYGQARWQATEDLGVTFGLRYTDDSKDSVRPYDNGIFLDQVSNIEDSSTDPMLTLDYDWTPDLNTYIRYATGYKAGGVNLRSGTFREYEKETLETWELGLKSTFWDQRARINIALWDSVYEDYQIDFSDPTDVTVSETFNASNGDVDLSGIEVEVSVVPVTGLTLSMDYNYMEWDLKSQPNPLNGDNLEVFEIPQAPRHAGTATINYEFEPFSFGTLILHLDYIGQSADRMRYSPKGNARRDGRDIINGRIMLVDIPVPAGSLRASLWGKNLSEEEFVEYSITNTGVLSISDAWNEPRTIGFDVTYEY